MLNFIARILGYIVSFIFPTYKSIKAIESPEKDDDTQWLVYWVIIGLINMVEAIFFFALDFIPLYYPLKLAVVIWLQYPLSTGSGSKFLYDNYLKPQLAKYDHDVDKMLQDVFKVVLSNPLVKQGIAKVKTMIKQAPSKKSQ